MKIVNIDLRDGNGCIQIAVDGDKKERLLDYLRDLDEIFLKKEYINQGYAIVILKELSDGT